MRSPRCFPVSLSVVVMMTLPAGCGLVADEVDQCAVISDTMRKAIDGIPQDLAATEDRIADLRDQAKGIDDSALRQSMEEFADTTQDYLRIRIYLDNDLAEDDGMTQELAKALDADVDVDSVHFVSQDEAWHEFRELYEDSPELADSVNPSDLPSRFDVMLENPDERETFVGRYGDYDGIDRILDLGKSLDEPGGGRPDKSGIESLREDFDSDCRSGS